LFGRRPGISHVACLSSDPVNRCRLPVCAPLGERLGVIDHPDFDRKGTPIRLRSLGDRRHGPLVLWATAALALQQDQFADFIARSCFAVVALPSWVLWMTSIRSRRGRLLLVVMFSAIALRLDPTLVIDRVHFAAWGWLVTPPLLLRR